MFVLWTYDYKSSHQTEMTVLCFPTCGFHSRLWKFEKLNTKGHQVRGGGGIKRRTREWFPRSPESAVHERWEFPSGWANNVLAMHDRCDSTGWWKWSRCFETETFILCRSFRDVPAFMRERERKKKITKEMFWKADEMTSYNMGR